MTNITLLGIDLAKNVFQLHGVDKEGKAVLKQKLNRSQLSKFIATLPICTIAMEACSGAHYWGRKFREFGHKVRIISPQYVKPFVKTNKNDAHDAQAITEAASRPEMRFVPIKNVEQQDVQCLHRIRQRLIEERTALMNQLRGLLSEYGEVIPQGASALKRQLPRILEEGENELTPMMRELCAELGEELKILEERLESYEKRIQELFRSNSVCQRLSKIEGIGPLSATILLTVLGDPELFENGRHFAAFLGLVPRQHSSGGKQRLLGISKHGDPYIRSLLIHGARSVVKTVDKKTDSSSQWVKRIKEGRGYNRASVALANKNARIIWAMVRRDEEYQK